MRNNIVHDSEKLSLEGSIRFLLKYWGELCDIQQQRLVFDSKGKNAIRSTLVSVRDKKDKTLEKWKPPDEGWVKINVDGAFDKSTGEGGLGVVIRDHLGAALSIGMGVHGTWKGCRGDGSVSIQGRPLSGLGVVQTVGCISHG